MSRSALPDARWSPPGFRFSRWDAAVIVLCSLATAWLWTRIGSLSLLLGIVLAHFFLFCNVFRVRTRYELLWGVAFILNATAWRMTGQFGLWELLGSQIPVTLLVIGATLRSASYHGIGHRWIRARSENRIRSLGTPEP